MTVFLAVKVPYRVALFSKEKNSKGCCPFESRHLKQQTFSFTTAT